MSGHYERIPIGVIERHVWGTGQVEYTTEYAEEWRGDGPLPRCEVCFDLGVDFTGPDRARFCTCEAGQAERALYAKKGLTEDDLAAEYAIVFEHRAKRLGG